MESLVEEVNPDFIENPFLIEYLDKCERRNAQKRERYANDTILRNDMRIRSRDYFDLHHDYLLDRMRLYSSKHKKEHAQGQKKSYARQKKANSKGYQNHVSIRKLTDKLGKESGYSRIRNYLYRRGIKPPLNYYLDCRAGKVSWAYAHP